jgi:cell filamentation protein
MMDKYGVGQDPYCYPDSVVLKNLLAITDEQELSDAEVALTEIRVFQFVPQFDALDFAYLC